MITRRIFDRVTISNVSSLMHWHFRGCATSIPPQARRGPTSTSVPNKQPPSHDDTNRAHNEPKAGFLQGEVLDLAVDLKSLKPGDKLEIPYEITVSESLHDFWDSAFHSQDRIHTSRPFARNMGLQDKVLPFPLVLFLTSAMTHADAAKVQVGFGKVLYLWPAFAGDTFTKSFQVQSVRTTSDGNHSIIAFTCDLINQRDRICMRAEKRMLFEFPSANCGSLVVPADEPEQLFRNHLFSKAMVLDELGSQSLAALRPGQLVLHSMQRSMSLSQSQQLASLVKLTHPRHFDTRTYDDSELMIPGGLVLGLAMSAASRDLHEVIHEELLNVNYVNSLHPGNLVGAISYVKGIDENVPGDLERVKLRTIGIKNMDIVNDLQDTPLPMELFAGDGPLLPKELELICKIKCPKLSKKVVVQMDRCVYRQSSRPSNMFLL